MDRSEFVHTTDTDDESSSPSWRSTKAEENRPQVNPSALDTTTSENPCSPGLYQDACLESIPSRGTFHLTSQSHQDVHITLEANGSTETNHADLAAQAGGINIDLHRPGILEHATPTGDAGNENAFATPNHVDGVEKLSFLSRPF